MKNPPRIQLEATIKSTEEMTGKVAAPRCRISMKVKGNPRAATLVQKTHLWH